MTDQLPTAVYLQDNFPDGFSDISETSSYKTVEICEEEQLRRDLLKYPSLDPNDQDLKFEKYNYIFIMSVPRAKRNFLLIVFF